MKLGNYVHELLKGNETVIIPGFGAFFTEYKPAEISETEIRPPSNRISFSSHIRNNEGLLVDYVASTENVSHFDALKIIEKERDNIVFLLDKGEEVILEETGKLSSNEKNEIVFIPFHDEKLSLNTFGLEAVLLEKLNEEQPEEVISDNEHLVEELIIEPYEEPTRVEENVSEVSDEIVENENIENGSLEATEVLVVEEPEQIETDKQEVVHEQETSEPFTNEPFFVTLEPKQEEIKKKAGWYWYLLILIPVLVAGIFISKNLKKEVLTITESDSDLIQQNTQDEIQLQNETIIITDSSQADYEEVLMKDSVATDSTNEITLSDFVPGQSVYYLVGGSFKDEENAMDYMQELKEKELEPFFMGKRGNFYMVGVGKFATEGQAIRAREVIWEKYPGAGLWVMKE